MTAISTIVHHVIVFSSFITCDKLSQPCPEEFQGRCRCQASLLSNATIDLVNCTNAGFNSSLVLQYLPTTTTMLIFTGNNIPKLNWNRIGKSSTTRKLNFIDLSNNSIQTIEGKGDSRLYDVETLIMNNNLITLSENMHGLLSDFVSLKELHLDNTFKPSGRYNTNLFSVYSLFRRSVKHVERISLRGNAIVRMNTLASFCTMPALFYLDLSDNYISELQIDSKCFRQVKLILLRNNSFERIPKENLDELPPTLSLDITDNPFLCDCRIVDLHLWLLRNDEKVVNGSTLRCFDGNPRSNIGKYIVDLSLIQCNLACKPGFFTTAFEVAMILFLVLFLMWFVCQNKKIIKAWMGQNVRCPCVVVQVQGNYRYSPLTDEDNQTFTTDDK